MEEISTIDEGRESNLDNSKVDSQQPIDSNLSFKEFAVEFASRHLSGKNIGGNIKPGEIEEILEKLEGNQDLVALMQKVAQMLPEEDRQLNRRAELLNYGCNGDIVDAIIKDLNAVNITPLQRIQILYLTVFCNFNATMIWKPSQDGHIANNLVYLEHLPKINGYVEFIWEALDMLGKNWIDKYELDKIIIGMDGFLETVLKNPELGCCVVNKFKKFATFDQAKGQWKNKKLFDFVMELVCTLHCVYSFDDNRLFVVDDGDRCFENLLNRIASCYDFNNDETKNKVLALWRNKNKDELLQCYGAISGRPAPHFVAKCKYAWLNIKVFFKWLACRIRLLVGIEKAGTENEFCQMGSPMNDTQSDFITKTKIKEKTYDYILGKAISTMMSNLFFKVYGEIKENGQKKDILLVKNKEISEQLSKKDKIVNENSKNKVDVETKQKNQVENKNDDVFLGENESIHFNLIDVLRNIKIDNNKFPKNNALKIYFFVKSENSDDHYEFNDKVKLPFDFENDYVCVKVEKFGYNSDYQGSGIITKDLKILINYGIDPDHDLDIKDSKNENMDLLKKAGYIQLDFSKDLTQNSGAYCQIKHNGTVVGHAWKEEEKVISDIDKNRQFINKLFGKSEQSQTENQNDNDINRMKAKLFTKLVIGALFRDEFGDDPVAAQIFDNNRVPRQEGNNSNKSLE